MIVTDNFPAFTSEKFEHFVTRNGVDHVTSPPYHPASNRLAEWALWAFKEGMRKMESGSPETTHTCFLFRYHIIPRSTMGIPPTELLMTWQLHSQFDLLHPDVENRIQHNEEWQKLNHDSHARSRDFQCGSPVNVYATLAEAHSGSQEVLLIWKALHLCSLSWRMVCKSAATWTMFVLKQNLKTLNLHTCGIFHGWFSTTHPSVT